MDSIVHFLFFFILGLSSQREKENFAGEMYSHWVQLVQWKADVSTSAFFLQIKASFQPRCTIKVFHIPGISSYKSEKCQNKILAHEKAEVERKPIGGFNESQKTKVRVKF